AGPPDRHRDQTDHRNEGLKGAEFTFPSQREPVLKRAVACLAWGFIATILHPMGLREATRGRSAVPSRLTTVRPEGSPRGRGGTSYRSGQISKPGQRGAFRGTAPRRSIERISCIRTFWKFGTD